MNKASRSHLSATAAKIFDPFAVSLMRAWRSWSTRCDGLVLFLLALMPLLLVLPSLSPFSLYRDDAWQALATRVPWSSDLFRVSVTAPGFAAVLRAWCGLTGTSELALQVPAVVGGVLGPPVLFLLGRRLGFSRVAAFLAGLLLAVGPTHVAYSARVKPYTLDAVFSVGLIFLALSVVDHPRRAGAWMRLIGFASLSLVFSGSITIVALPVIVVSAVSVGADRWALRRILGGVCFFVGLMSIWYFVVLDAPSNEALKEYWAKYFIPINQGLWQAFFSLLKVTGSLLVTAIRKRRSLFGPEMIVVGAAAAALTAGMLILPWLVSRWAWALLVTPVGLAYALAAAAIAPLGGGRTDLYLMPVILLLLVCPIEWLFRRRPPLGIGAAAAVGMVVLVLSLSTWGNTYPGEDLKSLTRAVESKAAPEDRIVVYPETTYMYAFYSKAGIGIQADDLSMTGFTPTSDDPRVHMLPGFEFTRNTPVYLRGEQHCVKILKETIRELAQSRGGGIWIVASTFYPEDRLSVLDETLREANYVPTDALTALKAEAVRWARRE